MTKYSDMTTLSEAILRGDDRELNEIVTALVAINVGVEDVLRVLLGCKLLQELSSKQTESDQRAGIVGNVSKILGIPELDSMTTFASLADFLRVRTLQSIVKKVNRTLTRRAALRLLCDNKVSRVERDARVVLVDCPSCSGEGEQHATNLMRIAPPPLCRRLQELFRPDHCSFGFAAHLFSSQEPPDSSISATSPTQPSSSSDASSEASSAATVFCLDPGLDIVSQVRAVYFARLKLFFYCLSKTPIYYLIKQ